MEMGQENVIALLLQQQEEVLREIRDQKKVWKKEVRRCTDRPWSFIVPCSLNKLGLTANIAEMHLRSVLYFGLRWNPTATCGVREWTRRC